MPKPGAGLQNLMTPKEREILEGFVKMKANNGATVRTQQKVRHIVYKLVATLHGVKRDDGVTPTLDTATYTDFSAVPSAIKNVKGDAITQNSRQSFITTLRALVEYMREEMGIEIEGKEHTFKKIIAGGASHENKEEIEPDDWQKVLNCHMTTRERTMVTLMFDGSLRPGEPLILKWSDMKINPEGALQYVITFKTDKPRTIIVKPDTVAVLEEWRRASGRKYGDDAPLFPDRFGGHYSTIMPIVKLFRRLRKDTGLVNMTPGSIRNSSITADVMAGYSEAYICFRCWGVASSPMINIYVEKVRSAQMQQEQQRKIGGGQSVKTEPDKPRGIANLKPCPACGKDNAMIGDFCSYCGATLDGKSKGKMAKLEQTLADMQRQMARQDVRMAEIRSGLLERDHGKK